ncbi:hypothetical protein [Brevibacillus invocatus]|uniref:hypothetical protein n=1 Tax=Brevibacillus invocatus TaxID=173959 RepID=UPI00203CBC9F|nr:hypothetical protein [Brevibacillus invocatus]MCM3081709.1 hypothetical protein [Brevibacillus invocatus]MCM3432117.1 hypothetical protein [Brevibacillus invocatus]
MKETLLIKHAVGGRTFLDTDKQPVAYQWEQSGTGWRLIVHKLSKASIEQILTWKDELNLFLFQQVPGEPMKKIWFYIKEGQVMYDEAKEELTIEADSRIEYIPDTFGSLH